LFNGFMTQEQLFKPITQTQLAQLSAADKDKFLEAQARVIEDLVRENGLLKDRTEELKQRTLQIDEEFITLKGRLIGSSASKSSTSDNKKLKKNKRKKVQLPSERYPDAELIEQEIGFKDTPNCDSCGSEMSFSGMHEVCEYVTMTPAVFRVIRQLRQKYRCSGCHSCIKTVPPMPRICPGGAYSDEMIIDVSLSKYCDLIPIERYAAMAGRNGMKDLPPQSLIQLTHYLADFCKPIYERIKEEVLLNRVIHADETPHRMLERGGKTSGGKPKAWYLWGFSDNKASSYFEVRNTRSSDVASELLKDSDCEYLVSDVFSGYNKAVRETNKQRLVDGKSEIQNVYCNAHAYRKFKELEDPTFKDICDLYKKIYRLEEIANRRPDKVRKLKARDRMPGLFEEIKTICLERLHEHSSKSAASRAMAYFIKNYDQLVLFIDVADVPIDNNPQERQLRNAVIGRKTWYGNHSPTGAKTSAILFSLVESCKLAGINPREYFRDLVRSQLLGEPTKTPKEFAESK